MIRVYNIYIINLNFFKLAVILYPSGVTETYKSSDLTFSDEEILKIFNENDFIRTVRLYEVPNTWCVWGENQMPDKNNFNKLGSDVVQENVFSEILFIHDTELDPAWMLTDTPILKNYEYFREDLLSFFDDIAENVIQEAQERSNTNNENLVFLNTLGPTEDKRIMFEFDPHGQSEEFYKVNFFEEFAKKVYSFLKQFYTDGETFVLFADQKTIIIVKDENVDFIMNKVNEDFQRRERYERCADIKKIMTSWHDYKNKEKKEDKPKKEKKKKKSDDKSDSQE